MLGYLRERETVNSERESENENFDGKNDDDALYNSRRKGVPNGYFFISILKIYFYFFFENDFLY